MADILITLSSADLGPYATEADFDDWAGYVAAHVDERTGFDCSVDQARFGAPGDDVVRLEYLASADEADIVAIRGVIADMWDDWCRKDASADTQMRVARPDDDDDESETD